MQLISDSQASLEMVEFTILDYFIISEAIGIVGAFFVGFYYSRKQMQKLSIDIESKILNDIEDKLYRIAEMTVSEPELAEIMDRDAKKRGSKVAFAMTTLNIWSFAFHMHQRKVLRDNEWNGLLRAMKAAFRGGTIGDYWKIVEPEKWFDPEFEDFINNEIIGRKGNST